MTTEQGLRGLYHSIYRLQYHLILVTKYHRKCLTAPMLARLRAIFADLCMKWECELLEFTGYPDHVHLLVALQPKVAPSVFVNNVKTVTLRLVRKEFAQHLKAFYWNPVFWSRSYCILSVGGAPLSVLKQYIEEQAGAD